MPIIGCTRKIRKADRKTVAEYKTSKMAALSSVHLHKKLMQYQDFRASFLRLLRHSAPRNATQNSSQ
ncbi:MAG: hypothetical protein CVV42_03400 [Candidatus Riflebacteria bacterium HGW-Riflebacteria-2]|nr:MAG: hypothetical protein CVV42_03400 [Candidatus Riflebacteria bacterium HGW-Riflebacteria-2]